MKNLASSIYVYMCMCIYIPDYMNEETYDVCLNSSNRVQSLRLGVINAFRSLGFGKGTDILLAKPEVFLRIEVKIVVTATKEEKREAFLALIVHLHRKVQYP